MKIAMFPDFPGRSHLIVTSSEVFFAASFFGRQHKLISSCENVFVCVCACGKSLPLTLHKVAKIFNSI